METTISIDLDDTIIMTQDDFSSARVWFAEYVSDRYDVDYDNAKSVQSQKSKDLLNKYGLSTQRFPNACVEALEDLVGNPSQTDKDRVFEIGRSAFKTEYQYKKRGYRKGSLDLLNLCKDISDHLVLLTSGDDTQQMRKVRALNLQEQFDEIRIVGMDEKHLSLTNLKESSEKTIHIGNSASSDVRAAQKAGVECLYIPESEWRESESIKRKESVHVAKSMDDALSEIAELTSSS